VVVQLTLGETVHRRSNKDADTAEDLAVMAHSSDLGDELRLGTEVVWKWM
jgi:hypothetical protein